MARGWSRHVVARRWYVCLLGLILTVGAMATVYRDPGVHWVRAEVTLTAPATIADALAAPDSGASLVPVTTVLEKVMDDDMPHAFVSDEAPFYAAVGEGLSIRQLDTGGQWSRNFSAPTLIVEVVEPDPKEAQDVLLATVAEIEARTLGLQAALGLDQERHITVTVDDVRQAHLVASGPGIARAWVVIGAVGLTASVVGSRLVDAIVRRRWPGAGPTAHASGVGAAR